MYLATGISVQYELWSCTEHNSNGFKHMRRKTLGKACHARLQGFANYLQLPRPSIVATVWCGKFRRAKLFMNAIRPCKKQILYVWSGSHCRYENQLWCHPALINSIRACRWCYHWWWKYRRWIKLDYWMYRLHWQQKRFARMGSRVWCHSRCIDRWREMFYNHMPWKQG